MTKSFRNRRKVAENFLILHQRRADTILFWPSVPQKIGLSVHCCFQVPENTLYACDRSLALTTFLSCSYDQFTLSATFSNFFLNKTTHLKLTSSSCFNAGNQISFLLRSVTKINKQQLNDSDWGFSCKVSGYKFKKERRTLHHLEHILADLAGSCVRVMISPCNNSLQKLSQVGFTLASLKL